MRWWTKHSVAFAVHASAFGFLLGFAAERQPLSDYNSNFWIEPSKTSWEPIAWKYTCKTPCNLTISPKCTAASCPDDDKQFYVEKPEDALTINIIGLASVYVGWSALGHLVAWLWQRYLRLIRHFDYAVTAPTMLVVLGCTYGLSSLWLIINPVLLGILILISAAIERRPGEPVVSPTSRTALIFYGLIFAYGFVVSPVLYGAAQITSESRYPPVDPNNSTIGYGTAPDFVLAFSIGTVLLFSSFVVPYAIDLFWYPLAGRESIYITLSMIAKTTLHLWLGLTVIETSVSVGEGQPSKDGRSDMDTLAIGLGGATALVIGLSILNRYGRMYDDSISSDESQGYLLTPFLF